MRDSWNYKPIDAGTALVFDALRGISAVIVVAAHAVFFLFDHSALLVKSMLNAGDLAVVTFFVISGFMIGSSILRRINSDKNNQLAVLEFARDRLRRLMPALALAMFIMALCYGYLMLQNSDGYREYWSIKQAVATPLFLIDMGVGISTPFLNGPLWSLSHEFWFYVTGALLALLLVAKVNTYLFSVLTILCLVVFSQLNAKWCAGLIVWISGALLALQYHQPNIAVTRLLYPITSLWRWAIKNHKKYTSIALFAGLSLTALLSLSVMHNNYIHYLYGLVLALNLSLGLSSQNQSQTFHRTQRLASYPAKLAPYSYTLYVVHYPLLLAWYEFSNGWKLDTISSLANCVLYFFLVVAFARLLAVKVEPKKQREKIFYN